MSLQTILAVAAAKAALTACHLTGRPGSSLPGVVLELKSPTVPKRVSQKRLDALLATAAKKARKQIDDKRYTAEMEAEGIAVLKYGVGFHGKHVALASESRQSSTKRQNGESDKPKRGKR